MVFAKEIPILVSKRDGTANLPKDIKLHSLIQFMVYNVALDMVDQIFKNEPKNEGVALATERLFGEDIGDLSPFICDNYDHNWYKTLRIPIQSFKAKDLMLIRKSMDIEAPPPKIKMTTKEFIIKTTGKNPHICPQCGQAEMEITQIIPPIRGSPVKIYQRPIPKDRIVNLKKHVA